MPERSDEGRLRIEAAKSARMSAMAPFHIEAAVAARGTERSLALHRSV